jgi:hypothetical protein
MSKVDELRKRFSNITNLTFQKFVEADKTETKKYLEYYCIIWNYKLIGGISISVTSLINLVSKFDELLPYITNKDIYSLTYRDVNILIDVISDAELKKTEKTFNRLEHIDILIENENFLLLAPKTHEGSIRYGAETRWCTAARKRKTEFVSYTKSKTLVYLIAKNKKVGNNYKKIAFLLPNQKNPLTTGIECWTQIDDKVPEDLLIKYGWDFNELLEITTAIRYYAIKKSIKDKAISNIYDTIDSLQSIDLTNFDKNIETLQKMKETSLVYEAEKTIKEFIERFKKFLD